MTATRQKEAMNNVASMAEIKGVNDDITPSISDLYQMIQSMVNLI